MTKKSSGIFSNTFMHKINEPLSQKKLLIDYDGFRIHLYEVDLYVI
jgi:hypothetical protein